MALKDPARFQIPQGNPLPEQIGDPMAMAAFDAPNAEKVGQDTKILHDVAEYMYTDGYKDIVSQLNDGKENLAATVGQIAGRLIANEYQMDSGAPEEEAAMAAQEGLIGAGAPPIPGGGTPQPPGGTAPVGPGGPSYG